MVEKRKPGRPPKKPSNVITDIPALKRKPGRPISDKTLNKLSSYKVPSSIYCPPPKAGHPTYYQPWMCDKIIEVASQGGFQSAMCIALGIRDPNTIRSWREKYPEFEDAYAWAEIYRKKYYESLLLDGITGDGNMPKFNATAMALMMNAKFSDEFKRTAEGASHNTAVTINTINMSPTQLTEKIAQITQKLKSLGEDYSPPEIQQEVIEGDLVDE